MVKFLHVLQLIAGLIYNNFFLTPKATRFNFLHTQKSCFSCQAEMPKYVVSRRESTHSELRLPRRVLPNEILIGIRKYYSFDVHILNLFQVEDPEVDPGFNYLEKRVHFILLNKMFRNEIVLKMDFFC